MDHETKRSATVTILGRAAALRAAQLLHLREGDVTRTPPRIEDGADLAEADAGIPEAQRYVLICEIACGGGGRVLKALDRRLAREVALKVPLDAYGEARLRQEPAAEARDHRREAITVLARYEHGGLAPDEQRELAAARAAAPR